MTKLLFVLVLIFLFALPALAQDDSNDVNFDKHKLEFLKTIPSTVDEGQNNIIRIKDTLNIKVLGIGIEQVENNFIDAHQIVNYTLSTSSYNNIFVICFHPTYKDGGYNVARAYVNFLINVDVDGKKYSWLKKITVY